MLECFAGVTANPLVVGLVAHALQVALDIVGGLEATNRSAVGLDAVTPSETIALDTVATRRLPTVDTRSGRTRSPRRVLLRAPRFCVRHLHRSVGRPQTAHPLIGLGSLLGVVLLIVLVLRVTR